MATAGSFGPFAAIVILLMFPVMITRDRDASKYRRGRELANNPTRAMAWESIPGQALAKAIDLEAMRKHPEILWNIRALIDRYALDPRVQDAFYHLSDEAVAAELGEAFSDALAAIAAEHAAPIREAWKARLEAKLQIEVEVEQARNDQIAAIEARRAGEKAREDFLRQTALSQAKAWLDPTDP